MWKVPVGPWSRPLGRALCWRFWRDVEPSAGYLVIWRPWTLHRRGLWRPLEALEAPGGPWRPWSPENGPVFYVLYLFLGVVRNLPPVLKFARRGGPGPPRPPEDPPWKKPASHDYFFRDQLVLRRTPPSTWPLVGATGPLAVGRRASDLDRPAPSMSRGISAAHHRKFLGFRDLGFRDLGFRVWV